MLLALLLITLNQRVFFASSSDGGSIDAYNVRVYNDSTWYVGLGVNMWNVDASAVYLLKFVNGQQVNGAYLGAVYGNVTSLDMDFYGDSIYVVWAGDSTWIRLAVLPLDLSSVRIISNFEGPFKRIWSSKIMFARYQNIVYGYHAFSYRGQNDEDSLILLRQQIFPQGRTDRCIFHGSSPSYVIDLDYIMKDDTFLVYLLKEGELTQDPNLAHCWLYVFTDDLGSGILDQSLNDVYLPFGMDTVWLSNFAITSNYAVAFANDYFDDNSYLFSQNFNYGRGGNSWVGPMRRSYPYSYFYVKGFTLQDSIFFPVIFENNGKIMFSTFKCGQGDISLSMMPPVPISDTNNFSDLPLLIYLYHSARRNLYRPCFDYSPSKATFVAVWHQDFWHWVGPPIMPVLDSSILWMYYDISPRVSEVRAFDYDLKWDAERKMLFVKSNYDDEFTVDVRDVLGRNVKNLKLEGGKGLRVDLPQKGVYFLVVKSRKGVSKSIKVINL